MQAAVLENLSDDLLISVLQESRNSLDQNICILPEAFHSLAVHAAIPTILAGSLELDCAEHTFAIAITIVRLFGQQRDPQHLTIWNAPASVRLICTTVSDELLEQFMLGLMISLKRSLLSVSLQFHCFPCVEIRVVRDVLCTAVQNAALQSLDVSLPLAPGMHVRFESRKVARYEKLPALRALRLLRLHNIHLLEGSICTSPTCTPLHSSLSQLTQLTQLALTCDKIRTNGRPKSSVVYSAGPLSECVASMHELQHLELACYKEDGTSHGMQLLDAIHTLTLLSQLNLASAFSAPTMSKLAVSPSIRGLQNLRHLDLSENIMDSRTCCFHSRFSSAPLPCTLQTLSLRFIGNCN
jgi:hypothetical protein